MNSNRFLKLCANWQPRVDTDEHEWMKTGTEFRIDSTPKTAKLAHA
jgi:hypothetical protein